MAAMNFPSSPSNGQTYTNPDTGVTYTYDGTDAKWKTTVTSNAFLPLSGGTLTGALNVTDIKHPSSGSNNIVLDSSGGVDMDAFTVSGSAPADSVNLDASGRLLVGTSSSSQNARAVFQGNSGGSGGFAGLVKLSFDTTTPSSGAGIGRLAFTDSGHVEAGTIECVRDGGTWTSGSSQPTRLVFSTTADGASSPTERLRIANNGIVTAYLPSTTNDTLNVYNTTTSAYRFYVTQGGTIFATNTTISAISDQRQKENIRDLDVGLNEILALKPRAFDWKEGCGKDIKNDKGFIAQEFEQVFPDLVDTWKGAAPEGEEPYKSVRQDLIPVLVKAIQEQQALITKLQAKVAALEAP